MFQKTRSQLTLAYLGILSIILSLFTNDEILVDRGQTIAWYDLEGETIATRDYELDIPFNIEHLEKIQNYAAIRSYTKSVISSDYPMTTKKPRETSFFQKRNNCPNG